ncbi:MAG: methyl-accepting chemotaxis protein [Anaerolineae bacterium]|nr:methyl-accepting chemotaxis protein [Anaerolineae bacterium]
MSRQPAIAMTGTEDEAWVEAKILERRARIASSYTPVIAWGTAALAVGAAILGLIFPGYGQLWGVAACAALVTATIVLYPFLYRRGHTTLAPLLIVAAVFVACVAGLVLLPEVGLALAVVLVLCMLIANLFLGPQASRGLVSVLLFVGAAIVAQEISPQWFRPLEPTIALIVGGVVLALTGAGSALAVRKNIAEQEAYFRQSHLANRAIERQVASEQQRRERLQLAVEEYARYLTGVGQGNLGARLVLDGGETESDDPLLKLGQRLNATVASLQAMIEEIRDVAASLESAAGEILAATTQQAAGASQQWAALSETMTTVEEVKVIADEAVMRAQEVGNASQRTVQVSRMGQEASARTVASMERIKEQVNGIAAATLALSEHTQQIGQIIASVSDLASQSNVLALNASIEAARAGESGKGFSIVAREMRSMAEQSKKATAQVKAILLDIQKMADATVLTTEEGAKRVDEGVVLARQAGEVIAELAGVLDETAQAAGQLMAGGRQQAGGVGQIAQAMQSISQATTQSLDSARQTERAAQDLNLLASRLAEKVDQYRWSATGASGKVK